MGHHRRVELPGTSWVSLADPAPEPARIQKEDPDRGTWYILSRTRNGPREPRDLETRAAADRTEIGIA